MPMVTKAEAVQRITDEFKKFTDEDWVDVFNELFARRMVKGQPSARKMQSIRKEVVDHVEQGLEVDDILSLWHIMFPKCRNREYDEEADTLSYDDQSAA
jgi:hypothetical protein